MTLVHHFDVNEQIVEDQKNWKVNIYMDLFLTDNAEISMEASRQGGCGPSISLFATVKQRSEVRISSFKKVS